MEKLSLADLAAGVAPSEPRASEAIVVQAPKTNEGTVPQPTPGSTVIDPVAVNAYLHEDMRFELVNTSGAVARMFMGVLATAAEGVGLNIVAPPAIGNGLAGVADENGASNPKFVQAAERARRSNFVFGSITVTTATTAAGIAQRDNPINIVMRDADANDCSKRGRLPFVWTDSNQSTITGPLAAGDFSGISYDVDDTVTVTVEFRIIGIGIRSMKQTA